MQASRTNLGENAGVRNRSQSWYGSLGPADYISSLQEGGHIYVETFGGHGENFRVLPKAGQLRKLLSRDVRFKYYKERKVGPIGFNSVAVTLFAQKRKVPPD
jgi:hypothetical protein